MYILGAFRFQMRSWDTLTDPSNEAAVHFANVGYAQNVASLDLEEIGQEIGKSLNDRPSRQYMYIHYPTAHF